MRREEQAVAVAVIQPQDPKRILLVRRPETPCEELPGLWGLPAATLKAGEDDSAAIFRLGRQKLDVVLTPRRLLAEGETERPGKKLAMRLYYATADGEPSMPVTPAGAAEGAKEAGVTFYSAWRWGALEDLQPAAVQGSLCAQLALESIPVHRLSHPERTL